MLITYFTISIITFFSSGAPSAIEVGCHSGDLSNAYECNEQQDDRSTKVDERSLPSKGGTTHQHKKRQGNGGNCLAKQNLLLVYNIRFCKDSF